MISSNQFPVNSSCMTKARIMYCSLRICKFWILQLTKWLVVLYHMLIMLTMVKTILMVLIRFPFNKRHLFKITMYIKTKEIINNNKTKIINNNTNKNNSNNLINKTKIINILSNNSNNNNNMDNNKVVSNNMVNNNNMVVEVVVMEILMKNTSHL